jgi:hypothetical protein
MLKKICGSKGEQAGLIGGCRTMHNQELHYLCSSPNIIRVIESKTRRWAEHVIPMGKKGSAWF